MIILMPEIIEIDGSYLEGGGQILRTSCALSTVTQKPCRVFNIRRGRPNPGLATQHLLGLRALAEFCGGKLEGDFIRSSEIIFYPAARFQGRITLNIPTAGSISLILQTLILPALLGPKTLKIIFNGGGTDTFFSPTMDYFRYVFLKILDGFGAKIEINIIQRGYYPEGGAKVEVLIHPAKLRPIVLRERGPLERIVIISGASNYLRTKKVAERQLAGAREILGRLRLPAEERAEYYQAKCPGSHMCIIAEFKNTVIGVDALGKLDKRAEEIGKEAALELLKEEKSGACLDRHLADQILPYMTLARGKSEITVSEITNHCKTNMWVIEKFLGGKFKIKDKTIVWSL